MGVRRGEGGKEGGREKIRKCIVAFLKFGVCLSFPSPFPSPPTWMLLEVGTHRAGSPWKFRATVPTADRGPISSQAAGCSPGLRPISPTLGAHLHQAEGGGHAGMAAV